MSIDAGARIGAVHLTVSDLGRSLQFYSDHVGFREHWRKGARAGIGAGGADLLVLHESPGAPLPHRTTGLYHFAVLVPSRAELARSLGNFALRRTPMQGFSDHRVSEALYLADPDGIGIEVYRDRPRDEWPRANGSIQMATDPLDVDNLLRDAEGGGRFEGLAPGTVIGHVHLRVSFLEDSEAFYTRALGMDLTARYGRSAAFFAAGGYHHHVAANTWVGVGAPRPPDGAIGLRYFEIQMPSVTAVTQTIDRLRAAGVEATDDRITDPSGNAMRIVAVNPAADRGDLA